MFVYRNCFTGDVSGGDMHTGGICDWIDVNHPEHSLYLIHAEGDGQDKAYRETNVLREITYPDTRVKTPALLFPLRAWKGNRVALPWHPERNIFIAGSHFLPDIWPVTGQARKAPGAVRVVYIHHIVQDMPRPSSLNTRLANMQERFCFNLIKYRFDKIITVNQEVVDGLRGRGFTQPILLSGNFVNDHKVTARPLSKKDITLAFCGRLVNQKGVDDFLEVCEVLQSHIPDFNAVMIGAGPEMGRLKERIETKSLRVEVTGFVSETRKFDFLARAKLFVLPSIEEGWGIVIAESLSVGTPVLAYKLPVYQHPFGDVIHTVPISDRAELAKTAAQLLASFSHDPTTYATVQKALLRKATLFSRDSVASEEFDFIMGDQHAKS
jgi:glycosyltransferase involved in cell wall biosynthesis